MVQGALVIGPVCMAIRALDVPFVLFLIPGEDVIPGIWVVPNKGHDSVILQLGHTAHLGDLDEVLVTISPVNIVTHG